MKLACFYILKKRLNYCDFISYRRYCLLYTSDAADEL